MPLTFDPEALPGDEDDVYAWEAGRDVAFESGHAADRDTFDYLLDAEMASGDLD